MFGTFTMARKTKIKPFILPSDFKQLNKYVVENKQQLMEKVLSSIEFAIEKNIPVIEVFGFENSDFVVAISQKEFGNNISHIYNFYIHNEWYELCGRVKKIESLLDNKLKTDEKK